MCCKRCHIIFLTSSLNGVGLKNQIRLLFFFLRYDPPIVFRRQSHFITFIFIKTMSYDILVQMAYSSWIHIFVAFSLKRVTCKFKQFTNSEVQRSPWLVFRKPQFFHTFSVILIWFCRITENVWENQGFLKTDHGLLCAPDLVYCFFELVS